MKTFRIFALLILAISLLAACAGPAQVEPLPTEGAPEVTEPASPEEPTQAPQDNPTAAPSEGQPGQPTPTIQDGVNGPLPAAGQAALAWISDVLGVPVEDVQIVSIEGAEFSDSCLGLGGPAESCLQALTNGFRIQVMAGGRLYTLHTDNAGEAIRQVPMMGLEAVSPEAAGQAAVTFLAAQLQQASDAIQVVSVEATDFPDQCLGVPIPNALCAQSVTPGFTVTLNVGGQTYEIHTDASASNMALVAQP